MRDLVEQLHELGGSFPNASKLAAIVLLLVLAGTMVRVVNRLLRRTYWRRIAVLRPEHVDQLRRSKRDQTLLTLVESLVRYVIYGAAIVIGISIVARGSASALFGASLVVIVVGFGLQRLLIDVVSGGLLLFEGHIAVGDFVEVHQPNVVGIVERFSLRNTTLLTLSGDRTIIMNGSITAMTRFANGLRDYRLELLANDPSQARAAVQRVVDRNVESPHRRYLLGPSVTGVEQLAGSDLVRIELRAVVPPSMEWLVESSLSAQLANELDELLVGDVDTFTISDPAFESYRRSVLVRE